MTPPTVAPVSELDRWLIAEWSAAMLHEGWARASIERGAKTLRRLARVSSAGLLEVSSLDVQRFAAVKARGMAPRALMKSPSWHRAIRILDAFYAWAGRRLLFPKGSPVERIKRIRRLPRDGGYSADPTTAGAHRRYDAVLHAAGLSVRDRAVLMCLAHGLSAEEVARLRVADVDRDGWALLVSGRRRRTVPLSPLAIERLEAWLNARPEVACASPWLFPTAKSGGRLDSDTVYALVREAARRAFPRPQQAEIRRRIRPGGFREVFAARLIRRGVPLDAFAALIGVHKVDLRRYAAVSVSPERIAVELARARRRFRRWI